MIYLAAKEERIGFLSLNQVTIGPQKGNYLAELKLFFIIKCNFHMISFL